MTNSKATDQLSKVNKELKKSMKSSQGEAVRLSNKEVLSSTIKGNSNVSDIFGNLTNQTIEKKD